MVATALIRLRFYYVLVLVSATLLLQDEVVLSILDLLLEDESVKVVAGLSSYGGIVWCLALKARTTSKASIVS